MNKDFNNLTELEQIAAVQQNVLVIRSIKNPSEAVQLAAMQQYGAAIEFIKNPTEKVQLASLKYLFEYDYELPKNVISPKAIDKWNKLQEMKKACE